MKEFIDFSTIQKRTARNCLNEEIIKPAEEEVVTEVYEEHAAEPIKDPEDILNISEFLIRNNRFRDKIAK